MTSFVHRDDEVLATCGGKFFFLPKPSIVKVLGLVDNNLAPL